MHHDRKHEVTLSGGNALFVRPLEADRATHQVGYKKLVCKYKQGAHACAHRLPRALQPHTARYKTVAQRWSPALPVVSTRNTSLQPYARAVGNLPGVLVLLASITKL